MTCVALMATSALNNTWTTILMKRKLMCGAWGVVFFNMMMSADFVYQETEDMVIELSKLFEILGTPTVTSHPSLFDQFDFFSSFPLLPKFAKLLSLRSVFPNIISEQAADLLAQLLHLDAEKRCSAN